MKERPIIFSGEMVRAILGGWKTQTRRVIPEKLQLCRSPEDEPDAFVDWCKYGHAGDRLWVRETFGPGIHDIVYRADGPADLLFGKWSPSIHMVRMQSRITLEIVSARAERLQQISEKDADAEGVYAVQSTAKGLEDKPYYRSFQPPIRLFELLWDSINAKRGYSWESNPWVWVITFKVVANGA